MSKLAFALVIAGGALIASTSAFANQQGGPDTTQAIPKIGVIANWNHTVDVPFVSGGPAPTVSVHALTGGPRSDPADEINYGRLTGMHS